MPRTQNYVLLFPLQEKGKQVAFRTESANQEVFTYQRIPFLWKKLLSLEEKSPSQYQIERKGRKQDYRLLLPYCLECVKACNTFYRRKTGTMINVCGHWYFSLKPETIVELAAISDQQFLNAVAEMKNVEELLSHSWTQAEKVGRVAKRKPFQDAKLVDWNLETPLLIWKDFLSYLKNKFRLEKKKLTHDVPFQGFDISAVDLQRLQSPQGWLSNDIMDAAGTLLSLRGHTHLSTIGPASTFFLPTLPFVQAFSKNQVVLKRALPKNWLDGMKLFTFFNFKAYSDIRQKGDHWALIFWDWTLHKVFWVDGLNHEIPDYAGTHILQYTKELSDLRDVKQAFTLERLILPKDFKQPDCYTCGPLAIFIAWIFAQSIAVSYETRIQEFPVSGIFPTFRKFVLSEILSSLS